jgi:hypothetical protein
VKKHPRQTSHLGQNTETHAWYRNPQSLISILAIITSTFVGILSIINSRAIANLDKKVYVPKLQYRIGQEEIGKIYIETINQGYAYADNVTVVVNWKTIEIKNCIPQAPFQDIQPVEPVIPGNLTFRLESLFPGDIFKLICEIYVPSDAISVLQSGASEPEYTPTSLPSEPEYTPTSLPSELTIPTDSILRLLIDGTVDQLNTTIPVQIPIPQQIDLLKDIVSVKVTAKNSSPGIEIGRPQNIYSYIEFTETTTPIP